MFSSSILTELTKKWGVRSFHSSITFWKSPQFESFTLCSSQVICVLMSEQGSFCDLHVFWKSKCPKGASSNSFHMCIQPFHLRAVWAQQEVKCVGHVPLAAPLPLPPLGGGGAGLPDVNAGLLPPGGVWPLPLWVKPPGQRLPPETGSQSAP